MHSVRLFILSGLLSLFCVLPLYAQVEELWLERGNEAFQAGKFSEAVEAFERVLKRDPSRTLVRYLLAQAYFGQGNMREADKSIVRVLREDSTRLEYLELQLAIGFPREPLEILRRTRKDELSAKILLVDSLSVLPNLQLGKGQMYEWLEWRKRLTVDGLTPATHAWIGPTRPRFGDVGAGKIDVLDIEHNQETATRVPDPFDIKRQEVSGHDIRYLTDRAEAAYPKAEHFFKRVLERDPMQQEAYLGLARLYLTRPNMIALKRIAKRMRSHLHTDYYGWSLGGYADHQLGNTTDASTLFDESKKLMPDSILSVYEDLGRVVDSENLQAGQSIEAFWQRKDPRLLTASNERLSEHYARVLYADLLFSEPLINMSGWDADRGQIHIRYGMPDTEFFMSNKVAECGADFVQQSAGLYHVFQYANDRFVFEQRMANANDFPFYAPCAQVISARSGIGALNDYQMHAADAIKEEPDRFNYDIGGTRIEFPYLASRFKGRGGEMDVYVPYGIPVETQALRVNQVLNLASGAFLLTAQDGIAEEHRRTVSEVTSDELTQFRGATLWIDAHHLRVRPGNYTLSVEFETKSGNGVGFSREPIEMAGYDGAQLQISDLLLAYTIEEQLSATGETPVGYVLRDGLEIKPAPWGVFNRTQPIYLYFEIYNLSKNAQGNTRYEVETVMVAHREEKGLAKVLKRAFRGRADEGVSVSFENTGNSVDDGQYLILDAVDQPPGTYIIVMRIKDLISDREIETRRIVLLE